MTIKRGTPYDQMLGQFVELGYEWEVIPDTSTPGNWLLNVYNSGGIGQDRTADDTPQIFGEDSIGGQRLYRRHPPGSAITVEGDGRISGRASSAGALTAYGRRETYQGDLRVNTLADASLKATQAISDYIRRSQPLTLTRQPRLVDPFPLVDYNLGDTVNVSEPPFMDKLGRRLVGLTWAVDADAEEVTEHYGAVSYVGEAALQQGVYQLLSKFEPIRDLDPDGGITLGGGTIPWLVAASDSPDVWKNAAAYLCSGTNDEDTIQQAINAAGGYVGLAPGTFNVESEAGGSPIDVSGTLIGLGGNATSAIFQSDSGKSSPGPLVLLSQFARLHNVYIECTDCDVVGLESSEGAVEGNWLIAGSSGGSTVVATSPSVASWDIHHNYLLSGSSDPIVDLVGGRFGVVGNLIFGDGSQIGVRVDDTSNTVISDNRIVSTLNGVYLLGSPTTASIVVVGNVVESPGQHGLVLSGCDDSIIEGNLIVEPGGDTNNTYDGVFLDGDSDRNMIVGNKVIPATGGNATRYGVNVSAATCDTNVVADNMLIPSGTFGTGSFNDAGTGTVTSRDGNGQFT